MNENSELIQMRTNEMEKSEDSSGGKLRRENSSGRQFKLPVVLFLTPIYL